ncbi:MAG: ABC transporter ATP-binding protein [Chlamydiales bacterium]|nr:ABC transporter ATP-binding protein [Chlamydiales bacterium]
MTLSAHNLCKTFFQETPISILNGIDLQVEKGKSIAIMGKSGEGKSTLLHILGTLESLTSGELFICGHPVRSTSLETLRNQQIGFIFQSFNLLEDYTVLQNILMPARIARAPVHPGSISHRKALFLLEKIGLLERKNFLSKFLSGGEKQRVAIARALLNDPDIILADEPSGNLDSTHSREVHKLLLNLTQQEKKTLIIVTHDRELASLCDRIYILKEGKLCTS